MNAEQPAPDPADKIASADSAFADDDVSWSVSPVRPRFGFQPLRFSADLERRFRNAHIELNIQRVRITHVAGILSMLAFLVIDKSLGWMLQPPEADMILLFGLIPLLAFGMWLPRIRGDWRVRQAAMTLNALLIAGCLLAIVVLGRERLQVFPYEPLLIMVFYGYFLSGLMFAPALLIGLTVTAGHAVLIADWSNGGLGLYQSFYLVLANAMGWIGLYLIERQQRTEFLLEQRLRQRADTDPLTRVMNRGAFRVHLDRAWDLAMREGRTIGLLLIDVDEFKLVNDNCGHLFGDDVLRHVGKQIRRDVRRSMDAGGRYGGDEFVVLFYDVTADYLREIAERLQACTASLRCSANGYDAPITLSIGGVLVKPRGHATPRDALRIADDRLYRVKEAGRDDVQISMMI